MKNIRLVLVILLGSFCTNELLAQQKVVVIPLGADDVDTVFTESETGNTRNEANQAYQYFESEIVGSIASAGDVDYYRIILPFCQRMTVETLAVGGDSCGTGGAIDSNVSILNSNETQLLGSNDDISNANSCSKAMGVSTSSGNINFYLVKVEASPTSCAQCIFNYRLKLSTEQWLC